MPYLATAMRLAADVAPHAPAAPGETVCGHRSHVDRYGFTWTCGRAVHTHRTAHVAYGAHPAYAGAPSEAAAIWRVDKASPAQRRHTMRYGQRSDKIVASRVPYFAAPLNPERIARVTVGGTAMIHTMPESAYRVFVNRYAEARADGCTVTDARNIAQDAADAHSVLAFNGYTGGYVVNPAELLRVTSRPSPYTGTVDPIVLPDDVTVVVSIDGGDDGGHNAECMEEERYDGADLEAWRNDEWRFVTVVVTITGADGHEVERGSLGGVEVGDYWPGTEESQLWCVARELIADTLAGLEDREEKANAEAYAVAAHVAKTRDARIALRAALRTWDNSDGADVNDPAQLWDEAVTLRNAVATYLDALED